MRRRILIATILAGGTIGLAATGTGQAAQSYCDPLAGCASVKLKPSKIAPGHSTKVYGSVGGGCRIPGTVTVYSRAFAHATRHSFAGVPALSIRTSSHGSFSANVTISHRIKAGSYHVGGRCGGGTVGSATLKVT